MATYMYTSTTGSNWDDDDDDFDPEVYKAAANYSASAPTIDDLGPLQHKPAVEDECEIKQCTASAPSESAVDYDIDTGFLPTYAQKMTELWFYGERRPAYVELSHENGYAYPHTRTKYTANWTATKLQMGANMELPLMMKPSMLKLSMTWDADSEGEYIKEGGFLFPSIPPPTLSYDSHSEEEQDEAYTPPDSPLLLLVDECKDQIEGVSDTLEICGYASTDMKKYDPVTGAIDLPAHGLETVEMEFLRGFADFSHISNDLDVEDIPGDARNIQHDRIDEPRELIGPTSTDETESVEKTKATEGLTTTTAEATHITALGAVTLAKNDLADFNEPQTFNNNCESAFGDFTQLTKTAMHAPNSSSPDLKYIHDSTNISLVWKTVSAGWFALSSVPWSRIAVAAAGALTDVVAFAARR